MDKIDTYIEKHPRWSSAINTLRALLLEHPFAEDLKWNAPVYSAYGRKLVGMAAFKNHFSLWFWEGHLMQDPYNHLENAQEGKTKYLRQWKFSDIAEIDPDHVRYYLSQTLELAAKNEAPKATDTRSAKTPAVPVLLLQETLSKDEVLQKAFEVFPPYKQKEFSEYILEAKREATREKRLQKVLDLIKKGQGLNDRYR